MTTLAATLIKTAQTTSYIEMLLSHKAHTANWLIALEISADEITPLAFSKAKLFKPAQYALCVEIRADGILYTIRKFCKRANGQTGYFQIIEQDVDFEIFYFGSWACYVNE